MRFISIIAIVGLLIQSATVGADDSGNNCLDDDNPHFESPCENEVDEFDRTPEPTKKPSAAPTKLPTASPSDKPSPSPSVSPSSLPTQKPSTSPTLKPSTSPTAKPSQNPTASPTGSPTAKPSASPSFSPTVSPSSSPTRADCESTNGIFGVVDEGVSVTVDFAYEVEVSLDEKGNETIQDNILPPLEKAIVDSILPVVFQEQCDRTNGRRLRSLRQLEVLGISQYPDDYIYDDLICGTFGEGNSCAVVSGEMMIYSSDIESASAAVQAIKAAIKVAMESGEIDDSHEDIIRVTYLDIDPNRNNGSGATGSDYGSLDKNTLIFAIVGALLGALLVATVVYRQKKRGGKDANTTNTGSVATPSVLVESESQVEVPLYS